MIAKRLVEIRSYKLKPGSGPAIHDAAQDPEGHFLTRASDGLEHRETSRNAFYSSAEWRQDLREAIMPPFEAHVDTAVCFTEAALSERRRSLANPS